MSFRTWRWISLALALAGGLLLLAAFFTENFWTNPLTCAGVVMMLASVVLDAVKVRCPACGRHLGDHSPITAARCPYCDAPLDGAGGARSEKEKEDT